MNRIVITGGNGMVGSELVSRLIKDYDITVIDKYDTNIIEYLNDIVFVNCDICDTETIEPHLKNAFAVIHLAATVHWTPKNSEDEMKFIEINKKASEKLFYACARSGVRRLLFFSTNDVYQDSESIIDESYEISPKSVYAKTKYSAEIAALKVYQETGMPICIFRPASIFGVSDKGSMKSLIALCKFGVVPMVKNGNNLKSLSFVKDIAHAVERYLKTDNHLGGICFNIATGTYTFGQLLDAIHEVFGYKFLRINLPKWLVFGIMAKLPILSKMAVAASTKAVDYRQFSKITGYLPQYNLDDALRICAHYYKNRN